MISMNTETLEYLYNLHFITAEQKDRIARLRANEVFSLYYELRWMMWVGAALLLAGLVVFGHNTIYTIGQHVLITLLFVLSGALVLLGRKGMAAAPPLVSAKAFSYWSILLGCFLFTFATGFWQYADAPFEQAWEVVGIISGCLCIALAYRFAHNGALALGLLNLALSTGLAVVPLHLIMRGYIPRMDLISVGYAYGSLMLIVGSCLHYLHIRRDFTLTYVQMTAHLLFMTTLAGLVTDDNKLLFFLILLVLCYCGLYYARHVRAFSLLLATTLYSYLGAAYVVSRVITDSALQTAYIIVSCAAVLVVLWTLRK